MPLHDGGWPSSAYGYRSLSLMMSAILLLLLLPLSLQSPSERVGVGASWTRQLARAQNGRSNLSSYNKKREHSFVHVLVVAIGKAIVTSNSSTG